MQIFQFSSFSVPEVVCLSAHLSCFFLDFSGGVQKNPGNQRGEEGNYAALEEALPLQSKVSQIFAWEGGNQETFSILGVERGFNSLRAGPT